MLLVRNPWLGTNALRAKADEHAARLRPVIEGLQARGITSQGALTRGLNRAGISSARGGSWHPASVLVPRDAQGRLAKCPNYLANLSR